MNRAALLLALFVSLPVPARADVHTAIAADVATGGKLWASSCRRSIEGGLCAKR